MLFLHPTPNTTGKNLSAPVNQPLVIARRGRSGYRMSDRAGPGVLGEGKNMAQFRPRPGCRSASHRLKHPIADIGTFDRIVQTLTNLIGNAIKFSPTAGKVDFETVSTELPDGRVRHEYTITDNGTASTNVLQVDAAKATAVTVNNAAAASLTGRIAEISCAILTFPSVRQFRYSTMFLFSVQRT